MATAHLQARGRRATWPYAGPPQKRLLFASLLAVVGAFLPWVDTAVGSFTGMAGAGLWTFYAGVAGLAGSMVRRPVVVTVHAAVLGAVAVSLPVWQLARLAGLGVGSIGGAWLPGIGLVVTFGAGVMAARSALELGRGLRTAPA